MGLINTRRRHHYGEWRKTGVMCDVWERRCTHRNCVARQTRNGPPPAPSQRPPRAPARATQPPRWESVVASATTPRPPVRLGNRGDGLIFVRPPIGLHCDLCEQPFTDRTEGAWTDPTCPEPYFLHHHCRPTTAATA